jgi:hypothetical protein
VRRYEEATLSADIRKQTFDLVWPASTIDYFSSEKLAAEIKSLKSIVAAAGVSPGTVEWQTGEEITVKQGGNLATATCRKGFQVVGGTCEGWLHQVVHPMTEFKRPEPLDTAVPGGRKMWATAACVRVRPD